MNNLLHRFQEIFLDFKELREQKIINSQNQIVGWNSSAITISGETLSGGTHSTHEQSRRIAIAEAIERKIVKQLIDSNDQIFLMDEIPSSSGCAVGFENKSTRARAIFEGIERWAWSKWIDYGFQLNEVSLKNVNLSPLAKYYCEKFDSVVLLQKEINISPKWMLIDKLQFGVVLGISKSGIYPGSRVSILGDDFWTHGFIEAYRNFVIANLNSSGHKNSIILQRINYFSKNKEIAMNQIKKASIQEWETPEIRLLKQFKLKESDSFYFWRSLCYDYIPWDKGAVDRFVY